MPLSQMAGHKLNKEEGITLFCSNRACTAQEVFAHHENAEKAYKIIKDKYKPSDIVRQ